MDDDSYVSSSAATAISVGPQPAAPIEQPQQEIRDYSMLFACIIAAVVIATLIGVVNLAVHLRKHH